MNMNNNNGYITVREAVEKRILSERDCLYVGYLLAIELKRILYETKGGGHFNINPDTVKVLKVDGEDIRVELVDADKGHEACNGKPDFDIEALNPCFLAPESFLGRFSPASDVYSLGMLLAYMRYGTFPYDISETMARDEILKVIKNNDPNIERRSRFDLLVTKAILNNANDRFKNAEEMGIAIVRILDIEMPKCFDCFKYEPKRNKGLRFNGRRLVFASDSKEKVNNTGLSSQEPKLNVNFEEKEGEGFEAVAGMSELKRKLSRDFVDIVSNKELAKEYDIQPPNMLFFGPPGTGKTYISQRLAEQCGLAFCSIKPSDLASVWVHGSQKLLRQLFEQAESLAKKNKRGCLLLIDEFDAVAPKRSEEDHNHQSGEVAELLTQLNDCVEKNIYVIGTTNFLNRIDKAVIRKGRVDEVVFIGMPDADCRRQIFELELKKRPHEDNIDMELLSKLTDGYTSSDISYMVKESARNSFEASIRTEDKNAIKISQAMLEEVISKTRPSVSADEVRQYEKMRDDYIRKNGSERRRIGFIS